MTLFETGDAADVDALTIMTPSWTPNQQDQPLNAE